MKDMALPREARGRRRSRVGGSRLLDRTLRLVALLCLVAGIRELDPRITPDQAIRARTVSGQLAG